MAEDSTEIIYAEQNQYDAVAGRPADHGFQFALTKPLRDLGVGLDGETNKSIVFNEPKRGELSGVVADTDDVGEGRVSANVRKIRNTGSSISVFLRPDELEAIGVEFGVDYTGEDGESLLPVVNVFAGDGVITFEPVTTRQVDFGSDEAVEQDGELIDAKLMMLPEAMRRDYIAVVENGWDPEDWAKEINLTQKEDSEHGTYNPAIHVRNNVETAKEYVDDMEEEGRPTFDDGERVKDMQPISRMPITEHGGSFRVYISDAVKRAIPEDEWNDVKGVMWHPNTVDEFGMLLGSVDTELPPTGDGRSNPRWNTITRTSPNQDKDYDDTTFYMYVSRDRFEQLGYDPDEIKAQSKAGNPLDIIIRAANRSIGLEHPTTVKREVPRPKATGKALQPTAAQRLRRIFDDISQVDAETAENLADEFGNVDAVFDATTEELEAVKGIGPKTAEKIKQQSEDSDDDRKSGGETLEAYN